MTTLHVRASSRGPAPGWHLWNQHAPRECEWEVADVAGRDGFSLRIVTREADRPGETHDECQARGLDLTKRLMAALRAALRAEGIGVR